MLRRRCGGALTPPRPTEPLPPLLGGEAKGTSGGDGDETAAGEADMGDGSAAAAAEAGEPTAMLLSFDSARLLRAARSSAACRSTLRMSVTAVVAIADAAGEGAASGEVIIRAGGGEPNDGLMCSGGSGTGTVPTVVERTDASNSRLCPAPGKVELAAVPPSGAVFARLSARGDVGLASLPRFVSDEGVAPAAVGRAAAAAAGAAVAAAAAFARAFIFALLITLVRVRTSMRVGWRTRRTKRDAWPVTDGCAWPAG